MRRILTATAVVLALAMSPVAPAPARAADAEDLIGLMIGLGAIYAIGRAIEKDQAKAAPVNRTTPFPGKPQSAFRHRTVPQECLRTYETRNGPVRGFASDCLERTMRRAERLPDACEIRIRTDRGPRDIYVPRCLRRDGWRIAEAGKGRRYD